MQDRNASMLKHGLKKRGYDWWWHSLVAEHSKTGEKKPFFFEYYIINPALSPHKVVFGLGGEHKPSYVMIKAGTWGKDAVQLHTYFPLAETLIEDNHLHFKAGDNICTETGISGEVNISEKQQNEHPEWMCGHGHLKWDLNICKKLSYSVGYGASRLFRRLNAFEMYWHVQGMLSQYEGEIIWNGEKYLVRPQSSCGYQDKNWGGDYTNPWIWLNCNNLKLKGSEDVLSDTSLDVGGGSPRIFGIPIKKKILVAFYLKGKLFEFNFSKFWKGNRQDFNCYIRQGKLFWEIIAQTRRNRIEIDFSCPLDTMLKVNYENPDGFRNHDELWNGGFASGEIRLFKKQGRKWELIEELEGTYGGCEYGEY